MGVLIMEQAFIEKMKEKLLEQKNTILESLAAQDEDYKKIVEAGGSGDEIDVASDVVDGRLLSHNSLIKVQDCLWFLMMNGNRLSRKTVCFPRRNVGIL